MSLKTSSREVLLKGVFKASAALHPLIRKNVFFRTAQQVPTQPVPLSAFRFPLKPAQAQEVHTSPPSRLPRAFLRLHDSAGISRHSQVCVHDHSAVPLPLSHCVQGLKCSNELVKESLRVSKSFCWRLFGSFFHIAYLQCSRTGIAGRVFVGADV